MYEKKAQKAQQDALAKAKPKPVKNTSDNWPVDS
jgi:hypothetical protein